MRKLSRKDVESRLSSRRKLPYHHKAGQFTLTASFKDQHIDWSRIRMAGALVSIATQAQIADAMGCSKSAVQKMIRIHFANPEQ